jgi:hypothetical protein
MATETRRRSNTITTFFQDLVDDTKGLVDDLLDRAKDLEEDSSGAVQDNHGGREAGGQVRHLHASITELSATVDRLVRPQRKTIVTDLESKTKAELQELADERGMTGVDQTSQTKDEMVAKVRQRLLP